MLTAPATRKTASVGLFAVAAAKDSETGPDLVFRRNIDAHGLPFAISPQPVAKESIGEDTAETVDEGVCLVFDCTFLAATHPLSSPPPTWV